MNEKALRLRRSFQKGLREAGVDEAGRGCLAGPVVAAAVILPESFRLPGLNDSKQLLPEPRMALRRKIERQALAWAVAVVDHEVIDRINILQATFNAMHQAVESLSHRPELLLIDGNRFRPYFGIPHHCVIGGDGHYSAIAAASILAKTHRDELMLKLHEQFPLYGWDKNKGYATRDHQEGLMLHGPCPLHRKSFRLHYGPDTASQQVAGIEISMQAPCG